MTQNVRSRGFSLTELLVILLVVALLGAGGWYVWQRQHRGAPVAQTNTTTSHSTKKTSSGIPSGWSLFQNKDMGIQFAYPHGWNLSQPRTIATASGQQGWAMTIELGGAQNGDPSATISTYPGTAAIKDVDAGANDSKVQTITIADGQSLTLAGTIEDPSKVSAPTQMYLSSCWPRNCAPKLQSGRFLSVYAGSTNNDCQRGMLCPTAINTAGQTFADFLGILQTIKSY